MAKRQRIVTFTQEDEIAIKAAARSLIGTAGILDDDIPDIIQELRITLHRKSNLFRSRKSPWEKFRGAILDHKVKDILRFRTQPSSRYFYNADISLNCSLDGSNPASEDSESLIDCVNQDGELSQGTEKGELRGLDIKIDVAALIAKLPRELADICLSLMERNVTETATMLKLDRKTIQRRMARIKRYMTEASLDAYL